MGPLLLVVLIGTGLSFALGLLHWDWLESTLGLDRGFEQVQTAEAAGGANGGRGGDLTWRLPPGPDPANNHGTARGPRPERPSVAPELTVPPARIASVARSGSAAPTLPGSPGCADSSAVARLISRYPSWADSDLGLIACGAIRSGFSAEQVRASLGKPTTVSAAGQGREEWRYGTLTVIVEQGRVISYGQ